MKIFKIIESGYGTNSSFEYGDGFGSGDGNGYGTGIKSGSKNGYETEVVYNTVYGTGCGDRYGSGFGSGYGIGSGSGTGCGDENKTGFGSGNDNYIKITLNKELEKVIFLIYKYFQIPFSIELIENKQVICIEEDLINQIVSFITLNFKEIEIEKVENNFIFFKNF